MPKFFPSKDNVHIHLVWKTKFEVLKELKAKARPNLIPLDTEKFPIISQLKQWKTLNPNACVTLWVDFEENLAGAKKLKQQLLNDDIEVRDIKSLSYLGVWVEIDNDGSHQIIANKTQDAVSLLDYFEADTWTIIDLIKIAVLINDFEQSKSSFSLFTDIDVKAFKVIPDSMLQGSLFTFLKWTDKGGKTVPNNGFFAFKNTSVSVGLLHKWLTLAIEDAFLEGKNAFFSLEQVFSSFCSPEPIPVKELTFITHSRQHDNHCDNASGTDLQPK